MVSQFAMFDSSLFKSSNIQIGVIDMNSNLIMLDYQNSQFEMLIELREFLRDYVKTCFFTNYYFEYEGRELNDFMEFKTLFQEHQNHIEKMESQQNTHTSSPSQSDTDQEQLGISQREGTIDHQGYQIKTQASGPCQNYNEANSINITIENQRVNQTLQRNVITLVMKPGKYTEKKVRQHLVRFKEIIHGENCILNYQLESLNGMNSYSFSSQQDLQEGEAAHQKSFFGNFSNQDTEHHLDYDSMINNYQEFNQDEQHLLLTDDIIFLRYLWGNSNLAKPYQNVSLAMAAANSQAQHSNPLGLNSQFLHRRSHSGNPLTSLKRSQNTIALTHPYSQLKERLKVPRINASKLIKQISKESILDLILDKADSKQQITANMRSKLKNNQSQSDQERHISYKIRDVLKRIEIQNRNVGHLQNESDNEYLYKIKIEIQNKEYEIKSSESGFYCCLNDIDQYQDGEHNEKILSSFTLAGLLVQLSRQFKECLQNHLKQLCFHDPYKTLTKCGSLNQKTSWFQSQSEHNRLKRKIQYQNEDIISNKEFETGIYGLDLKQGCAREWNDEYQQCKELSKDTQMQRIQRKRTIQKIYQDFVECAKIGALKVIEGNIQPLNPEDNLQQQIYVYQNIFFSFTIDSPFDFRETGDNNIPTYSASNLDLIGIQKLEQLEIDGIYNLSSCIVKYKQYRVVCQSIIPGILSFSQQKIIQEYGSCDNCNTIKMNREFHDSLLRIGQKLGLKSTLIQEQSTGLIKDVACSPEIKGIRGTDKRKYLVDLVRLSVRDGNFKDYETQGACNYREKLLKIYNLYKINPKISIKTLAKFSENSELILKLNSNVHTKVKCLQSSESFDQSDIDEIAQFLKTTVIDGMIKESLLVPEGGSTDSETLTRIFHFHGVNMRYLGHVIKRVRELLQKQKDKSKHLEFILEKEILVRSLKHLVVHLSITLDIQFEILLVHLMNSMLSSHICLDLLESGLIQLTESYLKRQEDIQTFQMTQQSFDEQHNYASEPAINESDSSYKKSFSLDLEKQQMGRLNKRSFNESTNSQLNQFIKQNQQCSASTDYEKSSDWSKKSTSTDQGSRKMSQFSNDFTEIENEDTLIKENYSSKKNCSNIFSNQFEQDIFTELQSSTQEQLQKYNQLTPSYLYDQINKISSARYDYQFNSKDGFKSLEIFSSTANKLAIIREICKMFGVVLQKKEYHLENVQNLCLFDQPKYEWLPFQLSNILEIIPSVKQLDHRNNEVDSIMSQANKAFKDGMYEIAFDCYAQCVSIYVQLQGPLQREAFDCLQRMSRIIYLQGDITLAVDLQIKAVQISCVLFGIDHSSTAYSLSTLAIYFQQIQEHEKALQLLEKAIQIFLIVEGKNHPDIAATYITLGYLFQELDMMYEALDCFFEAADRFRDCIGEDNMQVASCYSATAVVYFHLDELRTALEYQEKSHSILTKIQKKVMNDQSQAKVYANYIESSNQLISYYTGCCVQREKALRMNQQHMTSRQCKRALSRSGNQLHPQNLSFLDLLEYNRFLYQTLEYKK